MSNRYGLFVWHELVTTDLDAASRFYAAVNKWRVADSVMPHIDYRVAHADDRMVAGLMSLPEDARKMGAPPAWMGYVGVEDVDAATDKARALGGRVYRAPEDIPGVGRFSVIADPQGASLCLFRWSGDMTPAPVPPDAPGRVGWNELYATDIETDFPFYAALFGWRKADAVNMGEMGVYQMFARGDEVLGSMMNRPPNMPANFWGFYFNVADFDAAIGRINAAGGRIVHGPIQVPGGSWIAQALDPQGVLFSIVGRRE